MLKMVGGEQSDSETTETVVPAKRGRGRPRKIRDQEPQARLITPKAAKVPKPKVTPKASVSRATKAKDLIKGLSDGQIKEALQQIMRTWEKWQKEIARGAKIAEDCKAKVGLAKTELQEAVEFGVPVGDQAAEAKKCQRIVVAWQGLNDANGEASEEKKKAHEDLVRFKDAFAETMQDIRQLKLLFPQS